MSMTTSPFSADAAQLHDSEAGVHAWIFHVDSDRALLCAENEISIMLTIEDQTKLRSASGWSMFLIARGMLLPAAAVFGKWLADKQHNSTTTIEEGGITEVPVIENT